MAKRTDIEYQAHFNSLLTQFVADEDLGSVTNFMYTGADITATSGTPYVYPDFDDNEDTPATFYFGGDQNNVLKLSYNDMDITNGIKPATRARLLAAAAKWAGYRWQTYKIVRRIFHFANGAQGQAVSVSQGTFNPTVGNTHNFWQRTYELWEYLYPYYLPREKR